MSVGCMLGACDWGSAYPSHSEAFWMAVRKAAFNPQPYADLAEELARWRDGVRQWPVRGGNRAAVRPPFGSATTRLQRALQACMALAPYAEAPHGGEAAPIGLKRK